MNTVIKEVVGKYTLKEESLGVKCMPTPVIVTSGGLKISYVNPNTPEELADALISMFATSIHSKILSDKEKQVEDSIVTGIL